MADEDAIYNNMQEDVKSKRVEHQKVLMQRT